MFSQVHRLFPIPTFYVAVFLSQTLIERQVARHDCLYSLMADGNRFGEKTASEGKMFFT
jgi:hypothetical protein